jgi:hypothetical protein
MKCDNDLGTEAAAPLEKEREGAKELPLFLLLDGDDMPTPIDGNDSNISFYIRYGFFVYRSFLLC